MHNVSERFNVTLNKEKDNLTKLIIDITDITDEIEKGISGYLYFLGGALVTTAAFTIAMIVYKKKSEKTNSNIDYLS